MTNIIDGMDQARFKAGHPNPQKKEIQQKQKAEQKKMPMVLENLKNGS